MYLKKPEKFKSLYLDPGEDAGWCLANGPRLLAAGTEKMWPLADYIWQALVSGGSEGPLGSGETALGWTRHGVGEKAIDLPIGRIVCEDFRIYPEKAKALSWDPVRTARLIGAVTMLSRIFHLQFHLQPAAIKPEAEALGAEEYYYRPLHENRHQNDAIQHFVYFRAFGPNGSPRTEARVQKGADDPEARIGYQACGVTKSAKTTKGRRIIHTPLVCRKPVDHEGDHDFN